MKRTGRVALDGRMPRCQLLLTFAFFFLTVVPTSGGEQPIPVDNQFLVNAYTTGDQFLPSIAMHGDGHFVVAWTSAGSATGDSDSYSIQGQRFSADGTAEGAQFLVNSYTTDFQVSPSVAMDAAGNFVVVWESNQSDGDSDRGIQGRRFSAAGLPLGAEFQVNTYTTGRQSFGAVSMDAMGRFVVVWSSYGSDNGDSDGYSIQGQRFSSTGTREGPQFLVNSYTTSHQLTSTVAMGESGDFIVLWSSLGADSGDDDGYSVQGQRFGADGLPEGSQFQVNSYITNHQFFPAVAIDSAGRFVIAWSSNGSLDDSDGYSVQGQRFTSAGLPEGPQFQVNTYTTEDQRTPAAAMDALGNFVLTWRSEGSDNGDSESSSVQGRHFAFDGTPNGADFLVNAFTPNRQASAAAAMDDSGSFVVAWASAESDNGDTSYSVQGRRFRAQCLFADGFETGDAGQWSRMVGRQVP